MSFFCVRRWYKADVGFSPSAVTTFWKCIGCALHLDQSIEINRYGHRSTYRMPEIRATLHRKCLQLPKPSSLQGLARKAGNWKCRQKLCAPCQLFSYQAKIKRVRLVTMCLAKIGPNAGPGFGRSALCATLDGELAWLRCTLRRIAGGSSYCWQRIRRRMRNKVELFDAVTFYLQLGDCTQQIALQCFFLPLFCQQELTRATSFKIWTNEVDKIRLENSSFLYHLMDPHLH